jgi:uncharacterized membrane protein YphA (DoxX/SURF4 family)
MFKMLSRPMLASVFVAGAWTTLKDPLPAAKHAEPMIERYRAMFPDWVPSDPLTLVRIDACLKLGCGALLAINRLPRVAALLLAADLIPTTLVGHRVWESGDPNERNHFLKNVAMIGGLLATL